LVITSFGRRAGIFLINTVSTTFDSTSYFYLLECLHDRALYKFIIAKIRRITRHHPTGGLLLGGGGFFMPSLYVCPVSLRFQLFRLVKGWCNWLAPCTGQSPTQQPQNQHSSGYSTTGGLPFSELGTNTPDRQESTQVLQPVHNSVLKVTLRLGVIGFGTIYALL
jgi:hypothetical protein